MRNHNSPRTGCYFTLPAERLVLDGCRYWQAAQALERESGFEAARALFLSILPQRQAAAGLQALDLFVSQLAFCNGCPLKAFPAGAHHVTRDEVLLLGLISGIQNGDEYAVRTCLDHITCAARCEEVAFAAANFAITLRSFGQKLQPVPLVAIEDVLVRSRSVTLQ